MTATTYNPRPDVVVSVFHNVFRELEGRSDKRWWTVIVKQGQFVDTKHFDGQVVDGTDEAERTARRYAAEVNDRVAAT